MTKTIAFTGEGNTGKSTLIDKLENIVGEKGLFLKETAREVIQTIGVSDIKLFQEEIARLEYERVKEIKEAISKGVYDIIVCDRTWMDGIAYSIFNMTQGKIDGPIKLNGTDLQYDNVYFFDKPIKTTSTEEFKHYNNKGLNNLLRSLILSTFNNVEVYDNGKEDGDFIVKKILEDLEHENRTTRS